MGLTSLLLASTAVSQGGAIKFLLFFTSSSSHPPFLSLIKKFDFQLFLNVYVWLNFHNLNFPPPNKFVMAAPASIFKAIFDKLAGLVKAFFTI